MTVQIKTVKRTCKTKGCTTRFTVKSNSTKLFCSAGCQKAKSRTDKKPAKTASDYMTGPFWTDLFKQLSRAGTVEASPYNEGEYLAMSQLSKTRISFNGDMGNIFELSHIVPASRGGFFNLKNIVIAPMAMNRAHGSTHFGHGEYVDMVNADPRYLITATTPHDVIKQLLIDLHGEAFMLKEAKAVKPVKSTRKADLAQVLMTFNPCNDTHVDLLKSVEFINGLTGRQLKSAIEIVKGESIEPIYFAPSAPQYTVFISELARMTEFRPEFEVIATDLTAALATQQHCPSAFTTEHATILFNLLHGKAFNQGQAERLIMENTIEMRVRYSTGFAFHVIEDHHSFWLHDKADQVSFVSHWAIAQDASANLQAPF